MNDVAELKEFAAVHARAQNVPRYRAILDRISTDEDGAPGSWVREWSDEADRHAADGKPLLATRHYIMAGFPYPDSAARRQARARSVRAFDAWRRTRGSIEPLEVGFDGGTFRCWTAGLSRGKPRPLLLILGGIISTKEQWAPVLDGVTKLGMAGVVTEMPGVGENSLAYTPDSWRMLARVLDAVGGQALTSETYAMALSFGGHLALRCAVEDPRIRGIVTAGAPAREFFTDSAWQRTLPQITVDTLAHLTGIKPADLAGRLPEWALTTTQLAALRIPLRYVVSQRDEVIPPGEVRVLQRHVPDLRLLTNNDVHGSPRHVAETRLWSIWSLLHMRSALPVQRAITGALVQLMRAVRRW